MPTAKVQRPRAKRVRTKTFKIEDPLTREHAEASGIAPEQARRLLQETLMGIPARDLQRFRGGQVVIVI